MEEPEQPLVTDITSDEEVNPQRSLADQLRERRSEIAETKEVFLPLTGYEQFGVQVKHRLMDRVEVEGIGRKILAETRNRSERNMRILLDVIINSTQGFYIQDEETNKDEPEQLMDPSGATIYGWDGFATYLGWTTNGDEAHARAALYWVFGGNEFSIGQYGILLNRWMGNTSLKVDEEFLGEVLG